MRAILLLIVAVTFLNCRNDKKTTTAEAATAPTESTTPTESLSDAQVAEGWVLLFDGKSLNGWQFYKGRPNNTWEVKDGMLHCKPVQEGVQGVGDQRSDLMTTAEYADFELTFDWSIPKEANSGVMFRVTEEFEQPYYSGPEYQIVDDVDYPGGVQEAQKTAANYDVHTSAEKKLNPPGEWNSSKIVAKGNHVEHWLNGQKVVEYELGSSDWKRRVAASKWKEHPGYGMAPKGHIDLQDHGSEIWFRHILIRELK